MNADELRAAQAPWKTRYREDPQSARVTLEARGTLDVPAVACRVDTKLGVAEAGLHPATGGSNPLQVCSAEMLLEALVGCAGVTLSAVATALAIPIHGGTIIVQGDLDFRGTLGVEKTTPVGFQNIRIRFELATDATPEQWDALVRLTERYCVVFQTLKQPPALELIQTQTRTTSPPE